MMQQSENELWAKAINSLARREHSIFELRHKLLRINDDEILVERVIAQLCQQGYLSDVRFCEAYIRHRIERGVGPVRIQVELNQRGVAQELISNAFDELDYNWNTLAEAARQKRFGNFVPDDFSQRAKQMRFLQYRGFTSEHIRAAMKGDID